jgi:hypothetical protein
VRRQFAVAEQIDLELTYLLGAELVGGTVEMFRKLPDSAYIRACGSFGVITALEFLEH